MIRRKLRTPEYQSTRAVIDRLKESKEVRDDEENEIDVLRLERRFETLRAKSDFLQQDYVQDVVKRIKSIILSITQRLQEEDDSAKRLALKADRGAYRRVLTWFSSDVERDLAEVADRAKEMLR